MSYIYIMEQYNTKYQVLQRWAEIVIEVWQEKINQLGIGSSDNLVDNFYHHVVSNANGDIAKIEFAFHYYGKFVDMGVGKGIPLGVAGLNNKRVAKKWYSPSFAHQVKRLAEIMAEKYAEEGVLTITENTDDNALRHTPLNLDGGNATRTLPQRKPGNKTSSSSSRSDNFWRDYARIKGRGY